MSKKQKKTKEKLNQKLRREILSVFRDNPNKSFNYKQIASFMELSDKRIRQLIFDLLGELSQEGTIKEIQRGKYKNANNQKLYQGIIEVTKRGSGYFISDELEEDIKVPAKFLGKVIHGDKVEVALKSSDRNGKQEGRVVNIIDQNQRNFVGTLEVQGKYAFLLIDNYKINIDIFIPLGKLKNGRQGDKAVAKITDWPDSAKNPFGEIIEVLGSAESSDTEMKAILAAGGINYNFPDDVINEANRISTVISKEEIEERKDFREITTITIDPVDAKDFDDALSVEFLNNHNVRVGIHIADVGHYIPEGSALDKEAISRGNSVYLVDRVIPMLPEHLSNGVCSLRPNEEKLTFSAVFELTKTGSIVNEWFGKTIICSNRRFTYQEAQEIIESGSGDFENEVLTLDSIAKKLRKERLENGALEIQSSEIRFELNDKGEPINVFKKLMKDSNKLVEEFMLLANKRVGRYIGDTKRKTSIPFVYRIHDKPDLEKVKQFSVFVSKFGKEFRFKGERDIAIQMNKLFQEFKGESEFDMIQQMAIKSMAKAVYDTENIGHYGLGFNYYAHFTSPIRRYADLLVHRILFEELSSKLKRHNGLREIAEHISFTERRAVDAERASKKYFQAKYLENQIGEIFKGTITGLTEWGIYVQMEENYCEGMISLKSIKDDRYYFDDDEYAVIGSRSGNQFNIGDVLFVKLKKVSLAKKQIDLELVD